MPSTLLADLFHPAAVATGELLGPCEPDRLMPEELRCVPHAGPKRLREFAAGRVCARHALAVLGIEEVPITMASDRLPVWPRGIIGSITHTDGYCGAVVASRGVLHSLGLDTEVVENVSADLWPRICTAREISRIGALPAASALRAAALVFAAKEAWYKCQYPLSHQWVDFPQVTIEWGGLQTGIGEFSVQWEQAPAQELRFSPPWRGRFCFHEAYISAGIACTD
jgi:4'-phosphopantetheinyl transferase EntD